MRPRFGSPRFAAIVLLLALLAPGTLPGHEPTPAPPATTSLAEGTSLLEDLSLFAGLAGAKEPVDLGINAHMGGRAHLNWGLPLLEEVGLGVQLGAAIAYERNAVAVLETVIPTHDRTQFFATVGLFQRTDFGLSWGVAYDYRHEDYYASLSLGQWRGQVGFLVTDDDEVGLWGTVPGHGDDAAVAGTSFHLRPILQGNLFWRHTFVNQAFVRGWVGVAEQHDRFVLGLPAGPPERHPFVYGADLHVPLTDSLALFGQANFITPHDSGVVTATLGLAFFPGGGAARVAGGRFAPLQTVADAPTFCVDLEPR